MEQKINSIKQNRAGNAITAFPAHTVLNDGVDFVKLAQAMGAEAFRITKCEEVEEVLKKAIAVFSGIAVLAPRLAPRPYPIVPRPPEVISVRGARYL